MPTGIYKHKKGYHLTEEHKLSLRVPKKVPSALKGKTFEEIMGGVEKAKERKEYLRNYMKNNPLDEKALENIRIANSLRTKGKTYIDMYGEEKAKEIIKKKSASSKLSWEKNPFQGKSDEHRFRPYSDDWTESLRELVRQRDNYSCRLCGETEKKLGRKPDVHHIDWIKENSHPDNLISLCRACHRKVHSDSREYFEKLFRKLIHPEIFQKVSKLREFRCLGQNKRNRDCSQLLFKFAKTEDEVIVEVKCPQCNTFNILRIPFKSLNNNK